MIVYAIADAAVAVEPEVARGTCLVILEADPDEAERLAPLLGQEVDVAPPGRDPRAIEDDGTDRRALLVSRAEASRVLSSVIRLTRAGRSDVAIHAALEWLDRWSEVPDDLDAI